MRNPTKTWDYLNLAEVEMWDARGVQVPRTSLTVAMSSTWDNVWVPGNAIDGNTATISHAGSNTVDLSPYLHVGYPCSTSIASIKITNRQDCCQTRLQSYMVQLVTSGTVKWQSEFTSAQASYTFSNLQSTSGKHCYATSSCCRLLTV